MRNLVLLFLVSSALQTPSALAQKMTYGEAEYLNSCAVCHGEFGKGDGPRGDELRAGQLISPNSQDATVANTHTGTFSKSSMGVFPSRATASGKCRSGVANSSRRTRKSSEPWAAKP